MSLYHMLHGVSPTTFYVLPVLGKHPDWFPRFRDAFVGDEEREGTDGKLIVYTRTGGGNRDWYDSAEDYEASSGEKPSRDQTFNADIRALPGFLFDYDDDFDSTYANFVFDIPEQWVVDVGHVLNGRLQAVSDAYVELVAGTYPKVADKLREAFRPAAAEQPA